AQPLPELTAPADVEPLLPLAPLTSEAGFFARWRANHQERAARDGWIETDRPSFTLASSTVPQGWLQLESGYTYSYSNYPGWTAERWNTHTFGELNLRWGLTNRLELRVLWGGTQFANVTYQYSYY